MVKKLEKIQRKALKAQQFVNQNDHPSADCADFYNKKTLALSASI